MKNFAFFVLLTCISASAFAQNISAQPTLPGDNDPWTKKDLIETAELASLISNPRARKPVILNIGVVDNIPGAVALGGAGKAENLARLKKELTGLKRDQFIVIYCGCCPFDKCPNIRPAFRELKSSGFTNFRLLNVPVNMKQDWIARGYPLAQEKGG